MKKTIIVDGMNHIPIGSAVSRILEGLNGVERVALDLEQESILVEYDQGVLSEEDLCDAINEEGFEVVEIFDED